MSQSFSVNGDVDDILDDLDQIQLNISPLVVAESLNVIASDARIEGLSVTAKKLAVPFGLISKRSVVRGATRKRLSAFVTVLTYQLPVEKLTHKVSKTKGVTAGNVHFPRGFQATMKSGHTGVFQRKGRPRLPIVKLGVPLNPVLNNATKTAIQQFSYSFSEIFDERMAAELDKKSV